MKNKAIWIAALVMLLAPGLLLGRPAATSTQSAPPPSLPAAVQDTGVPITINEVLPNPAPGGSEWVELRNSSGMTAFLPLAFNAHAGGSTAATGMPPSGAQVMPIAAPLDISGWTLGDVDGNVYTVPDALPPVPPNGYVLVRFDGAGAAGDDYDWSDGVAVLHTPAGLVDVFEDDADQVGLYAGAVQDAATLRDFVAYGAPAGEDDDVAVAAGLWVEDLYTADTVQIPGGNVLVEGGSFGLYPGHDYNAPDDWTIYWPEEATPGAANRAPAPFFRNPPDGIRTTDRRIAFGWSSVVGATGYQFQLATDSAFTSLVIDQQVTDTTLVPGSDLADGVYTYRVRARDAGGAWSAYSVVRQCEVFTPPPAAAAAPQASSLLGITPQLQHKDSLMLCVDGHQRTGQDRWDSAHEDDGDWVVGNGNALRSNSHDNWYCTRASISMIVDFYGGSLSQDRISYYHYDGGTPEDDLGHGKGLWPDEMCTWGSGAAGDDDVFRWAMNYGATYDCSRGKPTFAQVRGFIDAGRPMLIVENGDSHSVVLDGYNTAGTLAHRVDPWTSTGSWVDFNSWSITEWHCPGVGAPRSDEASLWSDADGDGIVDFDEANRFATSPNNPDADEDWVGDKWDLYEVYFNSAGNYAPKAAGADMDGDGLRKEVDPDNDNGGTVDGCEDRDWDGRKDGGETDNFVAGDDGACVPTFEIRSPMSGAPGEVGDKSAPDKLMVRVLAAIPPAAGTLTLDASDFDVQIGGSAASIVVPPYPIGDEYWLIVQPPSKGTAGTYTLDVTLMGAQTDSEANAVHYSDVPRDPVDEVLVVDNSGSMADYDKMISAKNAARAFVDRWKTQDMVGLVAFSTTVSIPFPLVTVTSTNTLTDARTAINSMSDTPPGTWLTAIGSGLLEADKQLASASGGHAQSIVLLSDGMENVAPLWNDPASGVRAQFTGCSIKVHTVALGPSQASWRWLLQDISDNACGGGGEAWHTSGGGTSPTAAGLQATAFPTSLANRLADIYLSIAEMDARDQRLWEAAGLVSREPIGHKVEVPRGLPEAIWTVNWPAGPDAVLVEIYDPHGNLIKEGDPAVTRIHDATHDQYRISSPLEGTWEVRLRALEKQVEYLAVLSAHSEVQMWLLFGLIPLDRVVGMEMPIQVALADRSPISGAVVTATIRAPAQDLDEPLALYDDGKHGDSKADDGLYGNLYKLRTPGSYTVKAVAVGKSNDGEPFERHLTRSFYVRPRLAYIYNGKDGRGIAAAYDYQRLLQDNGFAVDLWDVHAIRADADFSLYSFAIVGPYTSSSGAWPNGDVVKALARTPALGLGEGGYDFFGELGLDIGAPNGWHLQKNQVYAVDTAHVVWHDPYPISLPRSRVVTVYTATASVGIYLPNPTEPLNVTRIGREADDQTHYVLVEDTNAPRHLLWGFQGPPETMTEVGRQLFVNVAWSLR